MPKRYILSIIYFGRALGDRRLHHRCRRARPPTLVFGAVTGLLWLSTVPPTSGLVALMFGTRWLTMLFGFAFFSHQVGGFLGVWLGGLLFEATGSYDVVWWLSVFFGVASAVINLPIVEKPVARPVAGRGMTRDVDACRTWRTPAVILVCGCLIGMIGFGPRSALGFFLTPMSAANGWGRDVFALALAIADAAVGRGPAVRRRDRRPLRRDPGAVRGALLYAVGLVLDGLFDDAA